MAIVQSARPREPKELKELFLLGPRMPLDQETRRILASNQDVLIIGDGKNPIDPADIKKILQERNYRIGPNTRIDIDAHGNRRQNGQHSMSLFQDMKLTKDIFRTLKEISSSNNPLYVHLWSCYGGSANKSVGELGNGSILVTHIEAKESSGVTLGDSVMDDSLQRYLDPKNSNLTPHQQFILDLPKNYEAATFNQSTLSGNKKFKFTRIPKEKYMADVLSLIDKGTSLKDFVNKFFARESTRFQDNFSNARVSDAIKQISHLSDKEAKEYATGILVHSFMTESQNRSWESLEQFVEKLQRKGVNINNTPDNNMNALHWATYNGNTNNIKMLLECGANPNILSKSNASALDFAIRANNNDGAKILLNNEKLIVDYKVIVKSIAGLINSQINNSSQQKHDESVNYKEKQNITYILLNKVTSEILKENPRIDKKEFLSNIIDSHKLVQRMAMEIIITPNDLQEQQNLTKKFTEKFTEKISELVIDKKDIIIQQSINKLEEKGFIISDATYEKIAKKLKPVLAEFPNDYLEKHKNELTKQLSENIYKEKTFLSNFRSSFKISSNNLDKITNKLHLQASAVQVGQKATSHINRNSNKTVLHRPKAIHKDKEKITKF